MEDPEVSAKDIERALHDGQFRFYFQPKVSFHSGAVVGGEALLRWLRPDGTVLAAAAFLPTAMKSGLITDITAVMLPVLIDEGKLRKLTQNRNIGGAPLGAPRNQQTQ